MLRFEWKCAAAALMMGLAVAEDKTIVETAIGNPNFKTLVAAVKAADLVETLSGPGPFTVFAPTDAAFEKVPADVLASLLKPENKDKLKAVLTYHVASGSLMAEQVTKMNGIVTVNGQQVDIKVDSGTAFADKAKIVTTDIKCKNGVIHVIDSVILPASDNLAVTATKAEKFKTLLAAVKAAGLLEVATGTDQYTIFAPTDEAFSKLPSGTVEDLLKPENKDKLAGILKYHVVPGRVYSSQAVKLGEAKTAQGGSVKIKVEDGKAMVNNAKLLSTDLDASNGVIHVIDTVLIPSADGATSFRPAPAPQVVMAPVQYATGTVIYHTAPVVSHVYVVQPVRTTCNGGRR